METSQQIIEVESATPALESAPVAVCSHGPGAHGPSVCPPGPRSTDATVILVLGAVIVATRFASHRIRRRHGV